MSCLSLTSKRSILLVLVVWSVAADPSGTAQVVCGRGPETAVRYEVPAFHDESRTTYSGVVRVRPYQGALSVTILAANRNKSQYYHPDEYVFFATHDGGKTWDMTHSDIPSPLGIAGSSFVEAPSSPTTLYRYLNDVGLYLRSLDGGKTWVLPRHFVEGSSPEAFVAKMTRSPSYYLEFRLAAVHPTDPMRLYATIKARPWNVTSQTELPEFPVSGIYVSYDGGENWGKFTDALDALSAPSTGSTTLGISPVNPKRIYGIGSRGLVQSANGGQDWATVGQAAWLMTPPLDSQGKPVLLNAAPVSLEVVQFVMDPQDERVLYVVSNKGVYRTTDDGESWVLLEVGFDKIGAVNSMAVNPSNPQEIFVGTTYGAFHSLNRGCTFEQLFPRGFSKTVTVRR